MYQEHELHRYDRRGKPRHPAPSPNWQEQKYQEEMGTESPPDYSPQFDYNPRTKKGKELLAQMLEEESA